MPEAFAMVLIVLLAALAGASGVHFTYRRRYGRVSVVPADSVGQRNERIVDDSELSPDELELLRWLATTDRTTSRTLAHLSGTDHDMVLYRCWRLIDLGFATCQIVEVDGPLEYELTSAGMALGRQQRLNGPEGESV